MRCAQAFECGARNQDARAESPARTGLDKRSSWYKGIRWETPIFFRQSSRSSRIAGSATAVVLEKRFRIRKACTNNSVARKRTPASQATNRRVGKCVVEVGVWIGCDSWQAGQSSREALSGREFVVAEISRHLQRCEWNAGKRGSPLEAS